MMAGKGLPQDCGLLVVGHGTADRVGEAETRTLVGHISDACPGGAVELGFLEVIGRLAIGEQDDDWPPISPLDLVTARHLIADAGGDEFQGGP